MGENTIVGNQAGNDVLCSHYGVYHGLYYDFIQHGLAMNSFTNATFAIALRGM